MIRENLQPWLNTGTGQKLLQNEALFLNHALTPNYRQIILQLGCLGWEDQFINYSTYQGSFMVHPVLSEQKFPQILSQVTDLPIASDSIDRIILPHLLEFELNRYQVLREVERVLKPEGVLIILGFNPWSLFSLSRFNGRMFSKKKCDGHFISRLRMIDWLHLLNFEAEVVAGFDHRTIANHYQQCTNNKTSLTVTAYAIRAIKRHVNMIPIQPYWVKSQPFALTNARVSTSTLKND